MDNIEPSIEYRPINNLKIPLTGGLITAAGFVIGRLIFNAETGNSITTLTEICRTDPTCVNFMVNFIKAWMSVNVTTGLITSSALGVGAGCGVLKVVYHKARGIITAHNDRLDP